MIVRDGKDREAWYHGEKKIVAAYHGDKLMWKEDNNGLPAGYTKLYGLVGGGTSYIDTGIIISPAHDVWYSDSTMISMATDRNARSIWAARDTQYYAVNFMNLYGKPRVLWGRAAVDFNVMGKDDGLKRVQYRVGNGELYVNGVKAGNLEAGKDSTITAFLFVRNRGGGAIDLNDGALNSMHALTVTRDGVVILDLIPALDVDGIPCAYNKANNTTLYNKGTGRFGYQLMDGTYVAPV